jgi:hypothetical protein
MHIALLIVVGALAQGTKPAPYYDFKPGTRWEYVMQRGSKSSGTMRMHVTRRAAAGKRVFVTSQESLTGRAKAKPAEKAVWFVHKGMVAWGKQKGKKIVPQLLVFKPNAKPGDTWIAAGTKKGSQLTARFIGNKTVTVPAGTFKNVKHIQIQPESNKAKVVLHLFLVPKVGFIQYTAHAGTMGRIQTRLKLKSYKIVK